MIRLRIFAAAALVVAAVSLSGCDLPPEGGTGGGGPPIGAPAGRDVLIAARDACTRQAQREGMAVAGLRGQQLVTGFGGRPTGAQVDLAVNRAGQSQVVRCDYDHARRSAVIVSTGGGGPDPNRPVLAAAREACVAEARREGYRINQVRSEAVISGPGGRAVGAALNVTVERRGVRSAARCEWRQGTDRARLVVEAEPVRGDRVLAAAREACIAEARDRGLRVNQVRSSTLTLDRDRRITGAELRITVETRGGQRSARICEYVHDGGRVRMRMI